MDSPGSIPLTRDGSCPFSVSCSCLEDMMHTASAKLLIGTVASRGETEITSRFPTIKNGGGGPMMVIRSMEGAECGRDGDGGLSSSLSMMTMLEGGTSFRIVFPHVENGGIHGAGGNWWTGVSSTGPHKSIPPKVGAVQMPPHSFVRVPQRCACSMEGYASQAMPSDSKSTSPTLVANGYKERI